MSMPNIPDMRPDITVSRNDAINILLSSIGMEELSLAHMLNAEAEKIQFALGTLEGSHKCPVSMQDIIEINKSSAKVLRDIIKNQMLLSMKLEDVIELLPTATEKPPCPPTCPPTCPPMSPPCPPPAPQSTYPHPNCNSCGNNINKQKNNYE